MLPIMFIAMLFAGRRFHRISPKIIENVNICDSTSIGNEVFTQECLGHDICIDDGKLHFDIAIIAGND